MAGFSKTISLGSVGELIVSEQAGIATLQVSIGAGIGGGQAAGVVKGKASIEVDVGAEQLVDLGFALAIAKFPSIAIELKAAQALIDKELAAN